MKPLPFTKNAKNPVEKTAIETYVSEAIYWSATTKAINTLLMDDPEFLDFIKALIKELAKKRERTAQNRFAFQ